MALGNPPCIELFVGCGSTDTFGDSSSSSGYSRSTGYGFTSSRSSRSISSSATSSSYNAETGFSSSSFFSSTSFSSFSPSSISTTQYSSSSSSSTQSVDVSAIGLATSDKGKGKGYKPVYMPRTGASDHLFASMTNDGLTPVLRTHEGSEMSVFPFMLVVSFGIVLLIALYQRRMNILAYIQGKVR